MGSVLSSAVGTGVGVLGNIGGAYVESNAAGNAANQQMAGAGAANQTLSSMWQQQQQNNQPWMQGGTGALADMQRMTAHAPSFTAQDFQNNMDPAYQFDLQQGQQALERSAAASGGLASGSTLKALTNYAQGAASHEYQNAYSRFMNNQNTQFSRLSNIADMGQNATMNTNALGSKYATQYGENQIGAANAQAGGTWAQGQIWENAIRGSANQMGNSISQMGSMGGGGGGGGGMPAPNYNAQTGTLSGIGQVTPISSDVGSMGGGLGSYAGLIG